MRDLDSAANCLATLPNRDGNVKRSKGLPNRAHPLTMATDISLESVVRFHSRGERLISPLSAIVYLAHHSGPNMATSAAARALEKSINPARFCMSVCVTVADGGLPQTIRTEKRCTISEHFLVN
uniref:(northern house mosquito) hypothetical protein n=1 Tax=Culex pipiens TaxID=7175 RepID=A0A8D8JDW8_CULPI